MTITIKDIAKLAGVSHTTVSRVLNGHASVKPETREKIAGLIKELHFSPHASARSLISGRKYTVGLLVLYDLQQFPHGFLPAVLLGITTELNKGGYNLILLFDQVRGKRNQVSPERLTANSLDGVFILSVEQETELAYRVAKIDLPVVLVNQKLDNLARHSVTTDDEGGAYAAVSHLAQSGRRAIAYIDGTPKYSSSVERKRGYRQALIAHGLIENPALQKVGYFDMIQGYTAMSEILSGPAAVDSVFCANDLMALGAMKAIRDKGLSVPQDIAVAGFDDSDFAAGVELTTVNKPRTQMGAEAARMMLELLYTADRESEKSIILPTRLVVRGSSVT